jgi:5-methylcytosine-specific restriction endonuclease McrA
MNYKSQILTKEWKAKRLVILQRDKFTCKKCGDKDKLHVHHKKYIKGRLAWEYPNNLLITLCASCHEFIHKNFKIKSVKDKFKKPKVKKISKKQLRLKSLYPNLYKFVTEKDK